MNREQNTIAVANRKKRSAARGQRSLTTRSPLTRERIAAEALRIVDRFGLRALSMRRLGAELGVNPMAVYHHLSDKEALLDAIVEAVMSEIDVSAEAPSASPEERIVGAVRAYRDVLLAHRNAMPVILTRYPSSPSALRPLEWLIGLLRDGGLSPPQRMAGAVTIAAAVRGIVAVAGAKGSKPPSRRRMEASLQALPQPDQFPLLRESISSAGDFLENDFDFGIRALIRGLFAQAHAESTRRAGSAQRGYRKGKTVPGNLMTR